MNMKWILELTDSQWSYVVLNIISIIGLFYSAVSSMLASNKSIVRKSYNVLPNLKVYGLNKENIILNVPGDIIYENLKENTSLFLGFLVSAIGFFLETILETSEIGSARLLILAAPISIMCFITLNLLSKIITKLRWLFIMYKFKINKIKPVSYNVFETDNVDDSKGFIHSSEYVRECSWERMVVNGEVLDKN